MHRYSGLLSAYGIALADSVAEAQEHVGLVVDEGERASLAGGAEGCPQATRIRCRSGWRGSRSARGACWRRRRRASLTSSTTCTSGAPELFENMIFSVREDQKRFFDREKCMIVQVRPHGLRADDARGRLGRGQDAGAVQERVHEHVQVSGKVHLRRSSLSLFLTKSHSCSCRRLFGFTLPERAIIADDVRYGAR